MARILKKGSCIILALVLMLTFLPVFTQAASKQPAAYDNRLDGKIRFSYLETVGNGFMRVYYNGSEVKVEYFDSSFNLTGKKSIAPELPLWGGFYKGEDGSYYLVEGKNNKNGKDGTEVLRIIKYNSKWSRVGAGSIYAKEGWEYEIRYPFNYGNVDMTEVNGKLYVITSREGYVDPQYGQGHQGMMLIRMDEATFKTEIVYGDFWHSFAQCIDHNGTDVYLYEQSEGSRATTLSKYDANSTDTDYFDAITESIHVLNYGGSRTSAWSIPCYATVDDFAVSGSNALGIGTSIDQSKYDNFDYSDTPYNIYLTVTPLSSFSEEATNVIWLTSYKKPRTLSSVKLTRINDNRFLVSWEVIKDDLTLTDKNDTLSGSELHYQFIDGNGKKIGSAFTVNAASSDCHPILAGDKVVYYASYGGCVDFYSINSTTGEFQKKVYRPMGSNATWKLKGKTLTISGSGTIKAGLNWYLLGNIRKIVIKKGITGIAKNTFNYVPGLKEIVIESGVTSIGKEAFAYNDTLKKVTIPSSVKKIGSNILRTGSRWAVNSPNTVYATIYTFKGSYAAKYAKKHNIKCVAKKASNPIKLKVTSKTFPQTELTASKSFKIGVTKAKGKVTYTPDKKAKKAGISVTKKGKVTIPAKCKKGSYKITVKAAGTSKYKAKRKTVSVIIE